MYKIEHINSILIDTFGKPLPVYQRELRKRKRDKLTVYQLRCLCYYLYTHVIGATIENVAQALGVPVHFVSYSIKLMRNELRQVKRRYS